VYIKTIAIESLATINADSDSDTDSDSDAEYEEDSEYESRLTCNISRYFDKIEFPEVDTNQELCKGDALSTSITLHKT